MLYPSINEIRKDSESRYTLVMLAAKRARQIIEGMPALIDVDKDLKKQAVSVASEEIARDFITYDEASESK